MPFAALDGVAGSGVLAPKPLRVDWSKKNEPLIVGSLAPHELRLRLREIFERHRELLLGLARGRDVEVHAHDAADATAFAHGRDHVHVVHGLACDDVVHRVAHDLAAHHARVDPAPKLDGLLGHAHAVDVRSEARAPVVQRERVLANQHALHVALPHLERERLEERVELGLARRLRHGFDEDADRDLGASSKLDLDAPEFHVIARRAELGARRLRLARGLE